ncbi:MAG: ATP-binding protein [Candidatus Promineifilaceae bacterium]
MPENSDRNLGLGVDGRKPAGELSSETDPRQVAYMIGGGLREGFRARLNVAADQVQEGSFLVCDSGRYRYYGLVTDLQLGASDPRFADERSQRLQPAMARALLGKTLYTTAVIYPTLMLDRGPDEPAAAEEWQARVAEGLETPGPKPVKTVPAHHTPVRLADAGDVAEIFGRDGPGMFEIGSTIEQGYPVRLDLSRLVKRSSGIFGATGTGKSFLTRMVLAGLMKEDVAAALVFDMHNEYGMDIRDPDTGHMVNGLKSFFGAKVQVAALGSAASVRDRQPDFTLEISSADLQASDILLLEGTLDLRGTSGVTVAALERTFGRDKWFAAFMRMRPGAVVVENPDSGKSEPAPDSVAFWANANNISASAAEGLHRKLKQIADRDYVKERPAQDAVRQIVDVLEAGRHVVLSFGRHETELDYLLVSNILTRRIREHWVHRSEAFRSREEAPPRPLVIAVEEAHKLLGPEVSAQTSFGAIARELRKYGVTLLVVDQRPSGIDDEVMSQLGTRITGWLGDDDDIRAVLSGLSGREHLRGMLARLQEKEEVLLLGWGVRMPIPVRSRRYDDAFFAQMRAGRPVAGRTPAELDADLFP